MRYKKIPAGLWCRRQGSNPNYTSGALVPAAAKCLINIYLCIHLFGLDLDQVRDVVAQDLFGRQGQLSRIDVKLKAGTSRDDFVRSLALPPGVHPIRRKTAIGS